MTVFELVNELLRCERPDAEVRVVIGDGKTAPVTEVGWVLDSVLIEGESDECI